jgi:hypothetical protein
MKLNDALIEQVSAKLGAQPIPEAAAAHEMLKKHFGDHTFYLDATGAYIWELVEEDDTSGMQLTAVQLASWVNEERSKLQAVPPLPKGQQLNISAN